MIRWEWNCNFCPFDKLRQTDRPTNRPINGRTMDIRGHRKYHLTLINWQTKEIIHREALPYIHKCICDLDNRYLCAFTYCALMFLLHFLHVFIGDIHIRDLYMQPFLVFQLTNRSINSCLNYCSVYVPIGHGIWDSLYVPLSFYASKNGDLTLMFCCF